MPLSQNQVEILRNAINNYCYPKVTFDFQNNNEVHHHTMRELESAVQNDLTSGDPSKVKDGLSNILYWGHRRAGYYWTRVENFREHITDTQLDYVAQLLRNSNNVDLKKIKRLKLPEFSNLSFLSKVKMFLDPTRFVILDLKLMSLASAGTNTFFKEIKRSPTSIPYTGINAEIYYDWCALCKRVAEKYFPNERVIAADVERGIFTLVENGQGAKAARIVSNL